MKITRSNYESWFLDYLEGNLDPSVDKEFQAFLNQNPDLAAELHEGEWVTLPTDEGIHFGPKDQLKKSVIDSEIEFQERAIAYHEGDLPIKEKSDFELYLAQNPEKLDVVNLIGNLKLVADQSIVFTDKWSLKRRSLVVPFWAKLAATAAVVILGYLLYTPDDKQLILFKSEVAVLNGQMNKDSVLSERKAKSEGKPAVKEPRLNQSLKAPGVVPVKPKRKTVEEKQEKTVVPDPHLRSPETEPSLLKLKGINLGKPGDVELAVMTIKEQVKVESDQVLSDLFKAQLAEIRQSGDRELLSTEHLGVTGLHLFAKLTGKRLTAHKDQDGTVKSVSYNSKLLAFSIPVNK